MSTWSDQSTRWVDLRTPPSGNAVRCRLFCFPFAGGGSSTYLGWEQYLPAAVQLGPVRLPGRETRWAETPANNLDELVQALVKIVRPYSAEPFAFFGHSMGALIAFELARQLRREGLGHPIHLFVSAARAPHYSNVDPPIHQLPDAKFVDELIRRHNGIPTEVRRNAELLEIVLPALRADLQLCETYVHRDEAPLLCPICVFSGARDHRLRPKDLEHWSNHTASRFRIELLPGDHFFVTQSKRALLRVITDELSWALAEIECAEG